MENMRSRKYLIGCDDLLDCAISDWSMTGIDDELIPLKLEMLENYSFNLSAIHKLSPNNATSFVAWGNDFMNFQRLEIVMEMKKLGFKLPPLICRNSFLADGVKIGENVYIGQGAQVCSSTKIGFNSIINPGTIISNNVEIGASCFIGSGSVINSQVKLGDHSIMGFATTIAQSTVIGKNCFIGDNLNINKSILDNTYITMSEKACVY